MKVIDVYSRYYEAEGIFNDRARHAAFVKLTATSEEGQIAYEYSVSFFPHDDPEDFAVSYDACFIKEIFRGKGRRTKKRDAEFMDALQVNIDELAESNGGRVFWDRPLTEARLG